MNVRVIGTDIAKNVFQLHGIDSQGNVVLKERVNRKKFLLVLSNLPQCLMWSTSNYWGRELTKLGKELNITCSTFYRHVSPTGEIRERGKKLLNT